MSAYVHFCVFSENARKENNNADCFYGRFLDLKKNARKVKK